MKYLLIIFTLIASLPALSQQRPDLFPQKDNLEATDEHYSQAGGTAVRILADSARMFYIPDIDIVALSYWH